MLTYKQFFVLYPKCSDVKGWVDAMNNLFPKYEIDSDKRIAAFISQCGHESGGWRVFSENLNYSEKALKAVFSKYFNDQKYNAKSYARKPEQIANLVYANRMGNGDESSGDGWKYRGRGPIQLTGYENYKNFSKDMNINVVDNPDLIEQNKEISLMTAIWYWNTNNLNMYADECDIKGLTKRINGGYNGLEDRIKHWELALHALGGIVPIVDFDDMGVLKNGSRGEAVKILQNALGIKADGVFGNNTEKVLKEWQEIMIFMLTELLAQTHYQNY